MITSPFELHKDRLATTDSKGHRLLIYPADVNGYFRRKRTQVQNVLIVLFLILPWIQINGRQALLLDVITRHFEVFGLSLRAHNAPLLILVLTAFAFGLFFLTAVFGRAWCGWACPQTVFIDGVFRKIERWIEGPALQRRKSDQENMSLPKAMKKLSKWSAFLLVSLVLTHSFLAYFVGTKALGEMMMTSPLENWGAFSFILALNAAILFNFGWFREQFCTIVCPYGRLQSVLMDHKSLVVAYDLNRGEPRRTPQSKAIAQNHNSKLGDCVNCYRCVQVCPTGIDIRRGVQLECIACTSCMDACDEVMSKIHKPTGLIKYTSLSGVSEKKYFKFNARTLSYLGLCLASIILLALLLGRMNPVDVEFFRAKDSPYTTQTLEDGSIFITNHFKVELSNQSGSDHQLVFKATDDFSSQEYQLIIAQQPLLVFDSKISHADIFIRFPKKLLLNGQRKVKVIVSGRSELNQLEIKLEKEVVLVGPFS